MIVSGIVPADKRRSKVFLDESFAFVLYKGEIAKFHIEEGQELPAEIYRQIMDEVICRRARERMLHMLKASSRTEQEIRRKLKEAFYPPQAIDEAVEFAKRYRYIDDENYAERYLEYHCGGKGMRRICSELRQKGVDREIIGRLKEECPEDEEEKARELLRRKRYDPENADAKEKRRMAGFLARRGFSGAVISHVLGHSAEFDIFL